MNKYNLLEKLLSENNGYLITSQVVETGISKTYMYNFVKKNNLKKVAQGVYMSGELQDDLYIVSLCNSGIIFSGETALYLHGLTEREPLLISVTVKEGYNASHLRKKGIVAHQVKKEKFDLGKTEVLTKYGNIVNVYDKERTICDMLKSKDKMDIHVFRYAMREYMEHDERRLNILMQYANKLGVLKRMQTYVEILT